jgi:hypothetical protein
MGIERGEILDWMGVDKGNAELVHFANQMQALALLKAAHGPMIIAFSKDGSQLIAWQKASAQP